MIELCDVLATWIRTRGLTLNDATRVLTQANDLVEPGLRASSHHDALTLAARYRITAYDARYLAVARDLGVRLVTEDAKLRRAAPALTRSLTEALAAE